MSYCSFTIHLVSFCDVLRAFGPGADLSSVAVLEHVVADRSVSVVL